MSASSKPLQFPLPGLSPRESLVLRKLVEWADDYLRKKEEFKGQRRYNPAPTTKQCTEHFKVPHKDMLALLNRLERQGLLKKDRQLSAGLEGNGYDGSLFSSVLPTARARELVLKNES